MISKFSTNIIKLLMFQHHKIQLQYNCNNNQITTIKQIKNGPDTKNGSHHI